MTAAAPVPAVRAELRWLHHGRYGHFKRALYWFAGRTIEQENKAHLGSGFEDLAETDVRKIGGVLAK